MKHTVWYMLVVMCGWWIGAASAAVLDGTITSVNDADGTFLLVTDADETHRVRMLAMECPQPDRPFGSAVRQLINKLVLQQPVLVVTAEEPDRFGRELGLLVVRDGLVFNYRLVDAGFCWVNREISVDAVLNALEDRARAEKRGVWQDADPAQPRARHR